MSPFKLDPIQFPGRAKIQFTTSAEMPHLIYRACLATGIVSNTVYCQHALVDALARDLGLDAEALRANLPRGRGPAAHLFDPAEGTMSRGPNLRDVSVSQYGGTIHTGPANTIEEVPNGPRNTDDTAGYG